MKIITHNGVFHADEVFGCALLKIMFKDKNIEIVRTRNSEIIRTGDIVLDVGGEYDEEINRFDHHMREFNIKRNNGIKYSSFGLVFEKFGLNYCNDNREIANMFDSILVQPIDAIDNGQQFIEKTMEINPYTISNIISDFNPTWDEENQNHDKAFLQAVEFAQQVIQNVYNKCNATIKARIVAQDAYNNNDNKEIVILEKYIPWQNVLCKYDEPKFVIYPDISGNEWRIQAVPETPNSFNTRIPLKEEWWGKSVEELKEIANIDDIVFVHKNGFIGGAISKESCVKMAITSLSKEDNKKGYFPDDWEK